MASGYDLKEAKYDQTIMTPTEIKHSLSPFFEKVSKKETTYKYAMFQSILDTMDMSTNKTFKVSFDVLFTRFAEIYWVLIVKHKLPQKAFTLHAPKTLAEKIIDDMIEKYKISKKKTFRELPESIQVEITLQMKKKCSKYVFGALYAETQGIFYSFSKDKEWIKINPLVINYIKKHRNGVQLQNYQAWGNFYAEVIMPGKEDADYYRRMLKREFGDNTTLKISLKKNEKKKDGYGRNIERTIRVEEQKSLFMYDQEVALKARKVLEKYPDLGLYLAQVVEQIHADKGTVAFVLENAYWCKKDGSRYYYVDISDAEIIAEATFMEEEAWTNNMAKDFYPEIDSDKIRMLDDPERLIKQLIKEKQSASDKVVRETKELKVTKVADVESKKQKPWEREEVVILVTEYFRTKGLDEESIIASQHKISDFLKKREQMLTGNPVDDIFRNFAGIRMQSSRIRCLDPETKYNGMQGTKLQIEVVQEYLQNPRALLKEADQIYKKYK